MRAFRLVAVAGIASTVLGASASFARADGGAYIDLDRTHYLPGQIAHAETYVTVPPSKQFLLRRGPFYAFILTGREWPQEGRPIPADAIRVGTFDIEHDRAETFELKANLSIPDVPGDFYSIAFCNDPCTVAGFREQITGYISIVQTEREAALLDEQQSLSAHVVKLRRDLRKEQRAFAELRAEFDAREQDRAYLAGEVNRLNHHLESARRSFSARPLVDVWWVVTGAAGTVLAFGVIGMRRRRRAPGRVANAR